MAGLALAAYFGVSSVRALVVPELATMLGWVGSGLALVSALLVTPAVVWKLRNVGAGDWSEYRGDGGYVAEAVSKAGTVAWGGTVLVLIGLRFLQERGAEIHLGPALDGLIAVAVATFSAVFLMLVRKEEEEEEDVLR